MTDDSELKTIAVKRLVEQVMATLTSPLTEDVIEDVFCAIESRHEWLIEYNGLCDDLTKTTVNNAVGVWVSKSLGLVGVQEVTTTRTNLASAYSKLSLPPAGTKRKKEVAEQVMSDYYLANKGRLHAGIVKKRPDLVQLLMDGLPAKEAFDMVEAQLKGR